MQEPASLLIYGSDASLIQTRRWVLERTGYRVLTTSQLQEFTQMLEAKRSDLVILCHSLKPQDRDDALGKATKLRPDLGRLILAADTATVVKGQHDELLSAFLDPQTLIKTVTAMIHRSNDTTGAQH